MVCAVIYGTIIMMGALGETLTEKAGHLNLGVPGIMYISGFLSYYAVYSYESSTSGPSVVAVILIALAAAFLAGSFFGLLYALMCVSFQCSQNVMGLLLTTFCVGFAKFLSSVVGIETSSKASFTGSVFNWQIPGVSSLPFVGPVFFGYGFMVYVTLVMVILMDLYLRKTWSGLSLRALGESPSTADAAGIDVSAYKYLATGIGCGICGLAGMIYVLQFGSGVWSTNNNIEAIGWLAVALVIFASWRPLRLIWGSFLFGLLFWAYNYLPAMMDLVSFTGFSELLKMLPYVVTIIILVVNSARQKKENQPPSSLGASYFREER
jgi:simple sugar transport system permease protein